MVLAVLVARFGTAPFERGLATTDARLLVLGFALTAVATVCCAWRWRTVSGALGVTLPLQIGFAACYRSQFLNAVLPGGVLGDVHRAVVRGREIGRPGRVAGTVAWERGLGLAVQATATLVVVVVLPTPLRAPVLIAVAVAAVVLAAVLGVVLAAGLLTGRRTGRPRPWTIALADLRRLTPRTLLATAAASVGVTACHAAVLAAAVSSTGTSLTAGRLLPLVLVVQLGSAVPTSIAGWGPREGVAAWAFATMGIGAGAGIAASVVYGVVAFAATVPGAVPLLLGTQAAGRARPAGERAGHG